MIVWILKDPDGEILSVHKTKQSAHSACRRDAVENGNVQSDYEIESFGVEN